MTNNGDTDKQKSRKRLSLASVATSLRLGVRSTESDPNSHEARSLRLPFLGPPTSKNIKQQLREAQQRAKGAENVDKGSILHFVTNRGQVSLIEHVLRKPKDIAKYLNLKDARGKTALQLAVERGDTSAARVLLLNGADMRVGTSTALHHALEANNEAMVGTIITTRLESICLVDIDGHTALHTSISKGSSSIASLLLENRIQVDALDKSNSTALQLAVRKQASEIVSMLLKHGAKITVVNEDNEIPLHEAIKAYRVNMRLLELLVEAHGRKNLDGTDLGGRSLLHDAIATRDTNVVGLIANAVNPRLVVLQDKSGLTPIDMVIGNSNFELLKILLDAGPIGCVDLKPAVHGDCDSLLHFAVKTNDSALARLLLDHGAGRGDGKEKCLWDARKRMKDFKDSSEILSLLLRFGANIDALVGGKTLLQAEATCADGIVEPRLEFVRFLLTNGASVKEINAAIIHDVRDSCAGNFFYDRLDVNAHGKVLGLLVQRGADINALREGKTILQKAALEARDTQLSEVAYLTWLGASVSGSNYAIVHDVDGLYSSDDSIRRRAQQTLATLLAHGADVNARRHGRTLLHEAFKRQNFPMARLLLSSGAEIDGVDDDGRTSLHVVFTALTKINPEMVEWLLEQGASADIQDKSGETPLFGAVRRQESRIVRLLVDKMASLDVENAAGQQIIHQAAMIGDPAILKWLLNRSKKCISSPNKSGNTPLIVATQFGNNRAIECLLSAGADPNWQGGSEGSALSHAVRRGYLEVSKLLLSHGALVDYKAEAPPLVAAIEIDRPDLVELLVPRSRMFKEYEYAREIFMTALVLGKDKAAQALLKTEMNPNVDLSEDLNTALHFVARRNKVAVARCLLERGAKVDPKNDEGFTPLQVAIASDSKEVAELLLKHKANPNAACRGINMLLFTASHGKVAMFTALIDNGADIMAKTPDGSSALTFALANQSVVMLRKLLDKGVDPETEVDSKARISPGGSKQRYRRNKIEEKNVLSPLMFAALSGSANVVRLLLERGANANKRDSEERTPLHQIILYKGTSKLLIAEMLISKGADPHILDQANGMTATQLAVSQKDVDLLKVLLLMRKGDIDMKERKWGMTALDMAMALGFNQGVILLFGKGATVTGKAAQFCTARRTRTWQGSGPPPREIRAVQVAKTLRIEIEICVVCGRGPERCTC